MTRRPAILIASLMLAFTANIASAQITTIRAGAQSAFSPQATTPCYPAEVIRFSRVTTRLRADCVFEDNAMRARVFAASGTGVGRVDVSGEVKVIVAHFRVDTPEGATSTGYVPFQANVPVEWSGRLFNGNIAPDIEIPGTERGPGAQANVNMFLRLRETADVDPNIVGDLISQSRFHGASHGGIFNCVSLPSDQVSAALMAVGCALAFSEREIGSAVAELSGVIRTNQAYSLELVVRGDLDSQISVCATCGGEFLNFGRSGVLDDFGVFWRESATIRVGTDPNEVVSELRDEIDELREELAGLREDFETHYHTYLTGNGNGHNNRLAETPPPLVPDAGESVSFPVKATVQN